MATCHFEWCHLIRQNVVEIVGEASVKHHGTSRYNDTFTCISHHHSHCIYHTHYQVLSQYTLVSSSSSSPVLQPINRHGYWQYGLVQYRTPTWGSHGKYQCSPIWQPKLWGQKTYVWLSWLSQNWKVGDLFTLYFAWRKKKSVCWGSSKL